MRPAPSDDDDTTPARRPVAAPARAAPAVSPPLPTPAHSQPFAWGLVGAVNRVEPLATLPGQVGVVRLLPNAVGYTRPPVDVGWTEVPAEPGRFEMAWPGDPAAARSLAAAAAVVRSAYELGGPLPAAFPAARELDAAVLALVEAAAALAGCGWGVGLLTPAGVLLEPTPDGPRATAVDLGFTWSGEFGDPPWDDSPGRPKWLDPDSAVNPAAVVWDRPPVEQQFAAPAGGPFPPPREEETVRTLARVIDWALTGRPRATVPHPAGAAAPVMTALADAAAGRVGTVAELADRLRSARPSGLFLEPEVVDLGPADDGPGHKPRARRPLLLAAAVGALMVAAGGVYFATRTGRPAEVADGGSPPTGTTPADPDPTPPDLPAPAAGFGDALREYEAVPPADLPGRLARFKPLAAAAGPADAAALAAARERLFADWVTASEGRVTAAADPARRAEAGHALRTLVESYRTVHAEFPRPDPDAHAKEQQWLEQYDREAEYLGWPR